jgi:protoporphyrinogen IX oxidase
MQFFFAEYYLVFKALHLIAAFAWLAGLFYLPRLYVYHVSQIPGGETDRLFQTMERRLLHAIMNPAMIAVWLLGIMLVIAGGSDIFTQGWFHAKLTAVLLMSGFHGLLARHRKEFVENRNQKSEKYYRAINEIPTILLIAIVFLAILKPF